MINIESVTVFFQQYGAFLAILISWIGFAIYKWKQNKEWKDKRFMRQVTVSLNMVDPPYRPWIRSDKDALHTKRKLKFRTIAEWEISEIWNNDIAVNTILDMADKTTVENPFVILTNKDDMGYIMRGLINKLSALCAPIYILEAMGKGHTASYGLDKFIMAITCEKYGATPAQKIRIMLIRQSDLDLFQDEKINSFTVEVPTHRDRIRTLVKLRKLLKTQSSPLYKGVPGTVVIELGATL